MSEKKDVKQIRVALGPEREAELAYLMKVWGLDRNAAIGKIISDAAKHLKDQESADSDMNTWVKLGEG
jgi:hypothetical protein